MITALERRRMDGPGGFFVIGLGYREDAGGFGGPLYLEELEGEEFALPVFFGPGTLERYAEGSPTLQGSRQEPWLS
jgi:hypothetical protein